MGYYDTTLSSFASTCEGVIPILQRRISQRLKTHIRVFPVSEVGSRFYSTRQGRWASRDPIGEVENFTKSVIRRWRVVTLLFRKIKPHLYSSFFNSPLFYVDADGRDENYWPPGNNAPTYPVILPIDPPPAPSGCPTKKSGLDQSYFGPWCKDNDFPHIDPSTKCPLDCYRSLPGLSGQQCCYDEDGDLATDENLPDIGDSPDKVSPASGKDADGNCKFDDLGLILGHIIEDLLPGMIEDALSEIGENLPPGFPMVPY